MLRLNIIRPSVQIESPKIIVPQVCCAPIARYDGNMHSNGGSTAKPSATALLAAARDLVEQPLTTLSDAETVELLRGVERAARMLTAVQHRLLIEVNTRSIP